MRTIFFYNFIRQRR